MSKSYGPEQTPPETTKDLDQSPTHVPEGFGARDMSPEGLHEQSLGNSERAVRLGLGGGDNTPALSDLNVEDWMNEPEASDVEHAPLPYKSELERGFGADLSGVTVRLGAREELDAQGAEATAEGETLSFASTHPDRELVAHEVAHLVQSREHGGSTSGRLSDPNEAAEQEADAAAKTVAEGGQAELKEGVTGVMRKKTSSEKKGPKINSQKKGLIQRWGVTIKIDKKTYDTFMAKAKTLGLASDGSIQGDVGGEALNLNFMKPRDMTTPGTTKAEPYIMAHRVKGGNVWIPLNSLENLVLKGRDARKESPKWKKTTCVAGEVKKQLGSKGAASAAKAGRLVGRAVKGDKTSRTLDGLRGNIDRVIGVMDREFGGWRDGWDAEMKAQVFILKNRRVKHRLSSVASGNLLKDYLPVEDQSPSGSPARTRPLYLNMNVPTGEVAPVVSDVIPPALQNEAGINVKHVRAETTGLYTAYDTAIQGYDSGHAKLYTALADADRELEKANAALEEFNKTGSGDSGILSQLTNTVDRSREARNQAQLNIDGTVKDMPLSEQKIGSLDWRYVEIYIPIMPGSATPGSATPGSATPGSATPGSATPGSATPGSATPGSATPGSATPGSTKSVKTSGWVPYNIKV
jgi:hypothetical protein